MIGEKSLRFHLSLMGDHFSHVELRPAGVEPTTFGSGGQRSIQLSYGRKRKGISHRFPRFSQIISTISRAHARNHGHAQIGEIGLQNPLLR